MLFLLGIHVFIELLQKFMKAFNKETVILEKFQVWWVVASAIPCVGNTGALPRGKPSSSEDDSPR